MWARRAVPARSFALHTTVLTSRPASASVLVFAASSPTLLHNPSSRRQLSLWPAGSSKPAKPDLLSETPPAPPTDAAPLIPTATPDVDKWTMARETLEQYDLYNTIFVGKIRWVFEFAHLESGLPWWSTIVCMAIFIRVALYPIMARTQRAARKIAQLRPITQPLLDRRVAAASTGDYEESARAIQELQAVFKNNGVKPLQAAAFPVLMIPTGICTFLAIRGLCAAKYPGMMTEGDFWFPDLTARDPYTILPVTSALCQVISIRTGAETGKDPRMANEMEVKMKNFVTAAMFAAIPFTAFMPTALLIYWNTTNVTGLLLATTFRFKIVQRFWGFPEPAQPAIIGHAPTAKPTSRWLDKVAASMPAANTTPAPKAFDLDDTLRQMRWKDSGPPSPIVPPGTPPQEGQFAAPPPTAVQSRVDEQGRVDDFGTQFIKHRNATKGNLWPLPPGIPNTDIVEPNRNYSREEAPDQRSPSAIPSTRELWREMREEDKAAGAAYAAQARAAGTGTAPRAGKAQPANISPQVMSGKGGRGYATAAYTADAIDEALLALRQPRARPTEEDIETRRRRALNLAGERRRLYAAGSSAVDSIDKSTPALEVEEAIRIVLQEQSPSSTELVDSLTKRLRRDYLLRAGLAGATTTLEYSSAQMAGRTIAALGATAEEVQAAIDLAASLAATQKSRAFKRNILIQRQANGQVDWSPPPPWQHQLDRLERRMMKTRWLDRFQRERTGRWKRILGWRVGEWDRTEANKLSHERRWARGSFEEWEERKALKLAAQKKRVPGYRRFQAYRKER